MKVKLTQNFIDRRKAAGVKARTIFWDSGMKGFGWQLTPSGHSSYCAQYRVGGRNGRSWRHTIDGRLALRAAQKLAQEILGQRAGPERKDSPSSPPFKAIAELYMAREGDKLRSAGERRRILRSDLYPRLGSVPVERIRRAAVVQLLDEVEDASGPREADHALALLRRILNWHAARTDEFSSPIVKGMGRTNAKERARTRTLSDPELRAFWRATANKPGAYSAMLRFTLLTACRRREASNMRWEELQAEPALWVIPASRHKSKKEFEVPLSPAAREVLDARPPQLSGWVFSIDGKVPISGFSKLKLGFDRLMLKELQREKPGAELPGWVIHDLRRTARSLMSRAGVPPRSAEMALGHVIPGVEGVYDRHGYVAEKRAALAELARIISEITGSSVRASSAGDVA